LTQGGILLLPERAGCVARARGKGLCKGKEWGGQHTCGERRNVRRLPLYHQTMP